MAEAHEGVQRHYGSAGITGRVLKVLADAGKDTAHLTAEMLYPFDQFHGRGLLATEEHTAKLNLTPHAHALDVGSGVGGPARYMATKYGCRVTGIDLTEEYVVAATELSARCGLADRVAFRRGNALALPFTDRSFDAATCFNVTMNIEDKAKVLSEIARVLKPGARLAYSEQGLGPKGDPVYPLPWARTAEVSFLVSPAMLRRYVKAAGLKVVEWHDETGAALAVARVEGTDAEILTLGNRIVMGEDFIERVRNMPRNLTEGRLVSTFVVAER
jgi:ubiquinone/menaquinone biosynthesis C-methylase UbiE